MKAIFHFLVFFAFSHFFQLAKAQETSSVWEQFLALSPEEKCRFCAQSVFILVFPETIDTARGQFEIAFEYQVCPSLGNLIFQNSTAISASTCSSLASTWNFFYPLFYYPGYPFRNFICYPLCGNSGSDMV